FKQRNGYDLPEFVRRSIASGNVPRIQTGDENDAAVGHAVAEATGRVGSAGGAGGDGAGEQDVIVLASGNLGLIYLMDAPRRLSLEEIDERHPRLIEALRRHQHIGFLLIRSRDRGPVVLGARGERYLDIDEVVGEDPLARFAPTAADHLRRSDGFAHVADIMVNSFYDAEVEQGCAFEELISFHGGLGGPQTQPFILHPVGLAMPPDPVIGAAAVHDVLLGWRRLLQGQPVGRGRPLEQPPTLPVRRPVS
ncbi:MAG TPA: hypothetical protein VHZ27_11460, partial [Solirubrobacteraceae bacterium]|nr:hypothetical protein [Solirubrobacteraceae bacterium]